MSRVFVPIPISGIEEEKEQPSLTYKLDLDTGRIVGKVDGLEAVNQFILKALLTPRFHCLVYDNQYGSEIKDTVTDESATEELIRAEIPRLVEDALLCDGRILKVYDFEFEFNEDKALQDGVLAILHDRIYQSCHHYLKLGYIDTSGLKNLEYLYKSYHALGGNGTGTELYNRAKTLPIKDNDN